MDITANFKEYLIMTDKAEAKVVFENEDIKIRSYQMDEFNLECIECIDKDDPKIRITIDYYEAHDNFEILYYNFNFEDGRDRNDTFDSEALEDRILEAIGEDTTTEDSFSRKVLVWFYQKRGK